jgi:hypothetical protein
MYTAFSAVTFKPVTLYPELLQTALNEGWSCPAMGIRYRHHGVYITEESFKALSADYTRLAEAGPPPTIGYPRYSELREVVEVIRQIRFPPEIISGIEDYSTAAWRDGHQEAVRAHSEVLW